jgi:protein TonB
VAVPPKPPAPQKSQKPQTPPQPETVQRPRRDPRPEPPQRVTQVQPQPQPELPLLLAAPQAPPTLQSPVVVPPSQIIAPAPTPVPSEAPRAAPVPTQVIPPRSDAAYLNNPPPPYPLAAKRNGEQGTVMVLVQVTVEGLAASVKLERSSGYPGLDDAALRAVRSWRFVPARQGDKPVAAPFVVPVVFSLKPQ